MSTTQLKEGALKLGIELSVQQLEQFSAYASLLEEWNAKINLTAIRPQDFDVLHFLDSLTVVPLLTGSFGEEAAALSCLDVGSGAGFPGIPLKIACPGLKLTALDSTHKKARFIETVSQSLGLAMDVVCERAEVAAHDPKLRERFDLVTARAVAALDVLAHWTLPFARVGGRVFALKSNTAQTEVEQAEAALSTLGGGIAVLHSFTLPTTEVERCIVEIIKESACPAALPKRR
ncbi:MAG: 16S rRNA (guanine(527)-N(7))-methyltransferase RsmG [Oligoflexia bacterium]|nr:16S rRNA (guanine(527)-N(7))-methyltransferase RsmG [Oligoflexia bacterium]